MMQQSQRSHPKTRSYRFLLAPLNILIVFLLSPRLSIIQIVLAPLLLSLVER